MKVRVLAVLWLFLCAGITNGWAQENETEEVGSIESKEVKSEKTPSSETPLPLDQIRNFTEIFTRIKNSYVEEVTDEELLDYAIRGMLNGLDPHSSYLKGEEFEELNEGTSGKFGGLGLEVVMENGFVKVITPIDDTPAAQAGVKPGDLIIRVDGKSVAGLSLRESTDMMRGEVGSKIIITIVRETEVEPFDLELERDVIQVKTVRKEWLTDEVGYIRISQFQLTTSELFRKEVKRFASKEHFSGLIIDLRNNPGGLLNSAVSISDMFIDDGVLLITKGRAGDINHEYQATPNDLINGKPVVVLINGGSASASEIVAGALQDRTRAVIVGTESFGKGSIQTVLNVGEKDGIKLTTGRYYTPSGRSIQAEGITPDILVEQREFKQAEKHIQRIKENDLPGRLSNDSKANQVDDESENKLLKDDLQLQEALNIIKAMAIYNSATKLNDPTLEIEAPEVKTNAEEK